MSFIPKPHEIYKHFKGNLYQVTAIAEHTETGEQLVVYQALYGDFRTYARPLVMFVDRVDRKKYPDATQEFRFELQGPEAGRQQAESQEALKENQVWNQPQQSQTWNQPQQSQTWNQPQQSQTWNQPQQSQAWNQSQEMPLASAAYSKSGIKPETVEDEEMVQKEESGLDPLLLEFLDADSYGERLNILAALHHRITDEMITTMAIASDIEINEGDIEERYEALKTCLLTLERYECNRLR